MEPSVTARHCEISDALRARAITVVQRLGTLISRSMESAVVFDTDATLQTVEIRLHIPRGEILVARGEAGDHRTALDRAEQRLRRQVERVAGRPRRTRSAPTDNVR
jgi:ribosomal subunit interface protein